MSAAPDQPEALAARIAKLEEEIVGLRRALQTRTAIGQATGMLAAIQECSPAQGFQVLVALSQQLNLKLHTVAVRLVDLAAEIGPRLAVGALGGRVDHAVSSAADQLVRAHEALIATEPGSAEWTERQSVLLEACGLLCGHFTAVKEAGEE